MNLFRSDLRRWLEENRPSTLVGVDPDYATEAENAQLEEWADTVFEAGYMCASWPKELGGLGLSPPGLAAMDEEFARARVPRPTRGVGEWLVAPSIIMWGTEEQKARLLPRIADGSDRYCQGFSEPDAGSDLASLRTRGEADGESVVITGQKIWTSGAERANTLFCLCRTDPDAPRHRGISYVLVPMFKPDGSSNGITLRPIRQMSGEADFTETVIEAAVAPLRNVIGGLNNGWSVTMTTLGNERAGGATTQHLPFAAQFWKAVELARKSGAASDPRVRQQLAWAFTHVEIMRFQGLRVLAEALQDRDPGPASSINKMFWSEYSQTFTNLVANIRGAEAMLLPDQPAGSYAPDYWNHELLFSRSSTIWGGTAEVQRNVVGERVLGLPRDK